MRDFKQLSNIRYLFHAHEVAAAKRSYYYLWWRYLRLSKNYWWLCRVKGDTVNLQFKSVYMDFGNVFEVSFADWWATHSKGLFALKMPEPTVRLMDSAVQYELSRYHMDDDFFKVAVPKHLTKTQILEQLAEALKFHEPSVLSDRFQSTSDVASTKGFKKHILNEAIRVWSLQQAINRHKIAGNLLRPERFTQLWIGKKLGLMRDEARSSGLRIKSEERQEQSIKVKVNRYISTVETLISNAERGVFPSSEKIPPAKLWGEGQFRAMNSAVAQGQWIPAETATKEIAGMLGLEQPAQDWLDAERESDLAVLLVDLEDQVFKKKLTIPQANELLQSRGYFLDVDDIPKLRSKSGADYFASALLSDAKNKRPSSDP
jgi:hypothetical protein